MHRQRSGVVDKFFELSATVAGLQQMCGFWATLAVLFVDRLAV
jgi:hypothetical protein